DGVGDRLTRIALAAYGWWRRRLPRSRCAIDDRDLCGFTLSTNDIPQLLFVFGFLLPGRFRLASQQVTHGLAIGVRHARYRPPVDEQTAGHVLPVRAPGTHCRSRGVRGLLVPGEERLLLRLAAEPVGHPWTFDHR